MFIFGCSLTTSLVKGESREYANINENCTMSVFKEVRVEVDGMRMLNRKITLIQNID